MTFSSTSDVLDRLAPARDFTVDWDDVLSRADLHPRRPRRRTWPRLVVLAALLAVAVPLTAIAESQDWWFFGAGAPEPATGVVVVKTGEWGGRGWQLVAYRTVNDGLCFAVAPVGSHGRGAMNCDQVVGVTPASTEVTPRAITSLIVGRTKELPPYVAGAVVDDAVEVVVYSVDGEVLRTPTFPPAKWLGPVRFFAAPLPAWGIPFALGANGYLDKLVGLDGTGRTVACLNLPLPPADTAPRSPCP